MKTVQHVLETKGREILSIGPEATVYEALGVMGTENVGALLVIDLEFPDGRTGCQR